MSGSKTHGRPISGGDGGRETSQGLCCVCFPCGQPRVRKRQEGEMPSSTRTNTSRINPTFPAYRSSDPPPPPPRQRIRPPFRHEPPRSRLRAKLKQEEAVAVAPTAPARRPRACSASARHAFCSSRGRSRRGVFGFSGALSCPERPRGELKAVSGGAGSLAVDRGVPAVSQGGRLNEWGGGERGRWSSLLQRHGRQGAGTTAPTVLCQMCWLRIVGVVGQSA